MEIVSRKSVLELDTWEMEIMMEGITEDIMDVIPTIIDTIMVDMADMAGLTKQINHADRQAGKL